MAPSIASGETIVLSSKVSRCLRSLRQGLSGAEIPEQGQACNIAISFNKEMLSTLNFTYMRAFTAVWPDRSIVQQLAAQIPWFRSCILLDRFSDAASAYTA